jgi:hypothetical protein
MRIYSILLWLITASLIQSLRGQDVKISGSGSGYAGAELRIFKQSDPVSKSMIPLVRIRCNREGEFSFTIPVKGTETIFINAGIFSFYIYASSGTVYELKLPDLIAKTSEDEQNSFFNPVKVIPEVVNQPGDINNLIRTFDAEFDPVFNRVADRVMYNVKLNEIPLLIEKLNTFSDVPGATGFYRDFVTFRLIMLNLVARGEHPGRIEDSIMINRHFLPDNPAYIDLAEQMFTGYFKDLSGGQLGESLKRAIMSSSLSDLKKVIIDDGIASDQELLEYIIIVNLYSAYYEGSVPADNVLGLLSYLSSGGSSAYLKELAIKIKERLLMLSVSANPPDIKLPDINGKQYSLNDFSGKFLLISFACSDNSFSIAEYGILNTWLSKYKEKLQMVTILRDSDFKKAFSRMSDYGFSWIMLDGSSADMLEYMYDVKLHPSFLLVDPAGLIVMRNCPFPSENLEALIGKISGKELK